MGQADELTDVEWRALEIFPGAPAPDLPFLDDDWFRYYHRAGDQNTVVAYEVHEMGCTSGRCAFRPEPCPWHPKGCDCSEGACQEDDDHVACPGCSDSHSDGRCCRCGDPQHPEKG